MSDFGTPPPPPPPSFPTVPAAPPPAGGPRTGPAWETPGPFVQRFIDTAKAVLTDPTTTFATMKRDGGLQVPLTYYLSGAAVGAIGAIIWNLAGLGLPFGGRSGAMHAAAGLGMLLFIACLYVVGVFLWSGVYHLVLMLFGGAKFPFETTFRVVAYALGSALPLSLVPFCGGMIGGVWALICVVIGLAQAQETTMGKAAAAVLVPFVLCCGIIALFWATIFALIAGGAAASSWH